MESIPIFTPDKLSQNIISRYTSWTNRQGFLLAIHKILFNDSRLLVDTFSRFVPKGHRWPGYAYFLDIRGWPIHPYDLLKPNIPNEFSCFSIDNIIIAIQSIWLIDNRGWKIFMLRGNIGMAIYHISGKYCHPCYIYNFFDSLILMYIRHDYYI